MGYLREIVERRYYRTSSHPSRAKDSVMVKLSCGHEVYFKGSKEPKHKAVCRECRMAAGKI